MKQLTKEQAIRYFHRMGMRDGEDISRFIYELSEISLMREFVNVGSVSIPLQFGEDAPVLFAPQITSLNPTKRTDLAQLLRKVARVIELSDVAFPQ